jgi:putative ABC transport system permease protein
MLRARIRALIRLAFFPARADRELDDELRFHLAQEAREYVERGKSEADARAAARRALGNVTRVKEETRAVWVSTRLEQLLQDLRFGFRILTRSPAISATAIVLIALVIGGNTTVFSIAHGILRKPTPGVHADDLTTVSWVTADGNVQSHNSYRAYLYFLEHSATVRPLAAVDFQRLTLAHDNGSFAVKATLVSPNYFDTLRAHLAKGRSFNADDARLDSSGVVVIAHHLWQNMFHGDDGVVGQAVSLNGVPATVVGVAEPHFRGAWLAELADVWVPLAPERSSLHPNHPSDAVSMIGRRAPGTSLREAQAELTTLWTQLQRVEPELNQKLKVRLVSYSATAGGDSLVGAYGDRMLAIFSVVTLLTIAIVCANVANLLIARAVVRQRELALRQSLGASRFRVVRGLLAEGLVLSAVAWCAACVFAWWVSKVVVRFIAPPSRQPLTLPDLRPDWTVVGYALALALLCTVAVTLGPALYTGRQQLLPFLKLGEQGVVQGRSKVSRALVVLQLAFSVLLLTTAGLAYRSVSIEDGFNLGFDSGSILLATVNTGGSTHDPAGDDALLESLRARLQRLPGVEAISYVRGVRTSNWLTFPVRTERSVEPVMAAQNIVGAGYFETVRVAFPAGHDFDAMNIPGRRTAIITKDLADALWPGESAIGKTVIAGGDARPLRAEVVGVVRDAYFGGRGSAAHPRYIFFSNHEQPRPPGETTFLIRHTAPEETVGRDVAKALREADARVAIASLRSLDDQLGGEIAPLWMLTTLVMFFAAGSLLIAAIGQYAVVAFEGRRRTREFGLRIALGASPEQLIASVLSDGFRWTAAGLVLGFTLSVGVATLLTRVLFGVTPTDPLTYVSVFALLSGASLAACYLPARRAARIDPVIALRTE